MATPYVFNPLSPFGGIQAGVTIGGIAYIVEGAMEPMRPTRKIRRNNADGDQSDCQFRAEPSTLKLKLQLANSTTTAPSVGVTFSAPDGTTGIGGGVTWVIHEVGVNYPQGEFWYCDVTAEGTVLATS